MCKITILELEGDGFEIELDLQPCEQLILRTNLSYQDTENKTISHVVHDAHEMQLYVNSQWDFLPVWSLEVQYFWIVDRNREKVNPWMENDDYHLINMIIRSQNIPKDWDVTIAVLNFFDEDAREPSPQDTTALQEAFIPNEQPQKAFRS